MLETGKGRPIQNVGIVARKAIEKASASRRPIQINPDEVEPNREINSDRTS